MCIESWYLYVISFISVCSYEGEMYGAGETFLAADKCNACTCQEDGQTACTLKACLVSVD